MGKGNSTGGALDHLDLNIIRILMENGREPSVAVAHQLGITDKTVNKRMAKLIKNKVIRIRAAPDPRKIGFPVLAILGIQVDGRSLRKMATEIAAMPYANFVGISTGAYDIIVLAVFRSQDELANSLIDNLASVSGIRRIETYTILRVFKRTAEWELPRDVPPTPKTTGHTKNPSRKRSHS